MILGLVLRGKAPRGGRAETVRTVRSFIEPHLDEKEKRSDNRDEHE